MKSLPAEALRPHDETGARDESGEDAAERPNPVVVHGQLQKPGRSDQQSNDPDAAEELRADAVFERCPVSGGSAALEAAAADEAAAAAVRFDDSRGALRRS